MPTQTSTDEKPEVATMTLRFLELPDALAPLVGRHGSPQVQVSEWMSAFLWFVEDGHLADEEDGGMILARVADEDALAGCVADIEMLDRALRDAGRRPRAIMASCGESGLTSSSRDDLAWARDLAMLNGFSWVAINEFEASAPHIHDLRLVFDWEPDEMPRAWDGTEQILRLDGQGIAATDSCDLWTGTTPAWRLSIHEFER